MGSPTKKGRKDKPHVIPYCRFTKIIICHLGKIHNIHQRSASLFHLAEEDFKLGNLKFIPKGEIDEVFGMPIPDELISNNIRNAAYYNAYLEMVTNYGLKVSAKKEGMKKTTPTTKEASTGPSTQPLDDTSANIVRDSPSPADAETGARSDKTSSGGDTKVLQMTKELGKDTWIQENIKEKTVELDQGQAGPNPGRTPKSQPPPKQEVIDEYQARPDPRESHGALARQDPECTHDKFMVDLYPKNLKDGFTIGDQFINDKSTEDEPEKPNVEVKVVSMVTVLIYQASSLVPPLVYTLKLRDLPHKIDEAVREKVKEAVQIALQAPLRDRFRDLSEEDMKEILHQRIGTSSLLKRTSLVKDNVIIKTLLLLHQIQILVKGDDMTLALLVLHSLKLLSHQHGRNNDRRATSEPDWVIPTSHIPDDANNWSNPLASTYQAPTKNSLLVNTRDMRTFMHWYCQKMGNTKLTQAYFEGQAYEVIKACYPDVIHLQFQMEECHKMLTDQVDWANPEGDQVRIDVSKPLPLSDPPGHVTIQTQFFFNHDLDYLRYGSKGTGRLCRFRR
uniref:Histone deacetylase 14 n=1 Tax=Tanacetum cinerariifolium TaxID=118510 RepID=A0A699JB29_TANCI|nr:histone deacetylase 14 [Tanacetum cinerariifolium]